MIGEDWFKGKRTKCWRKRKTNYETKDAMMRKIVIYKCEFFESGGNSGLCEHKSGRVNVISLTSWDNVLKTWAFKLNFHSSFLIFVIWQPWLQYRWEWLGVTWPFHVSPSSRHTATAFSRYKESKPEGQREVEQHGLRFVLILLHLMQMIDFFKQLQLELRKPIGSSIDLYKLTIFFFNGFPAIHVHNYSCNRWIDKTEDWYFPTTKLILHWMK